MVQTATHGDAVLAECEAPENPYGTARYLCSAAG